MKFILAYNEQTKKLTLIDGFYDNEEDIKVAILKDIKNQFPEDLHETNFTLDDNIKIRMETIFIQHLPLEFETKYGTFKMIYIIQSDDSFRK